MDEAYVRRRLHKPLKRVGYLPMTTTNVVICRKCGTKQWPPSGKPDVIALHPNAPAVMIEVKALKIKPGVRSFPFNDIKDNQREWLADWADASGKGYIALGVIQDGESIGKEKDTLLGLFVVPWMEWLEVEARVLPHQGSIPYVLTKTSRLALREDALCISVQFRKYDVLAKGGPRFDGHPINV